MNIANHSKRSMTELPATLFRTTNSREALYNHLKGILWFRSPRYFREPGEDLSADPSEGIGSYKLPNGQICHDLDDDSDVPIIPFFMLSFSEIPLTKFGKYIFEISGLTELEKRVENICSIVKGSHISFQKIEYGKVEQLETDPGPSESWNRKYFSKPREFAGEKEWRLAINFPSQFRIGNNTLELHVRNLQGILNLMQTA